jgi:membrane protease YdiL (CAAX protease family)
MSESQKQNKLFEEIKNLGQIIAGLDKKVVVIFLSVAILQTISWYYTSRRFFRSHLFDSIPSGYDVYLFEYVYWFISDFFTLFVLSVIIIKFILKENLKDYGLALGDYKTGIKISALFLAVMLPIIWIVSSTESFIQKYPHLHTARESWTIFFIYESGMLLYMFAWEFIWRGFMLFGLKERFGYYAVFIQMIPFVILHNGKPELETFGAIAGGIALGILALRTKSFYYCVAVHIGIMFLIDIISALRFRAEDYGIGLNSIFNIIKEIF